MKSQPDKALEKTHAHKFTRTYFVEIVPRTWWSRAIVVAVFIALLSIAILFFSLFITIGIAIVALAVVVGLLKYIVKGPPRSGIQVDKIRSNDSDTDR